MIAIVVSREDRASEHVRDHLLEFVEWETETDESRSPAAGGGTVHRHGPFELRTFDDLHLEIEDAASAFSTTPDLLAFASRHSGDTGPLLTAHFTGNFGPAEFGGRDDALATAAPGAQAHLLGAFDEHAPEGYAVGMECTHHGPSTVGCPSLFVELGSGDDQWDDPAGAAAVARAILALDALVGDTDRDERDGNAPATTERIRGERTVVGFGGGHYVPRFERVVRETAWTVGHVAADWALEAMLDADPESERDDANAFDAHRDVLEAAFEASDAEHALIDGNRPELAATIDALGYRVVSETWLRAVDDRDLDAVDALETALSSVDDGLRFGDVHPSALAATDDWTIRDLPADLLDAARRIDDDATRRAIAATTVAFETRHNGSQPAGRAAFPVAAFPVDETALDAIDATRAPTVPTGDADADRPPAYDRLVEALVAVLAGEYDEVTVETDRVRAVVSAFDPALARDRGVPEGPKFGALADGEQVAVDGEEVDPEAVHARREDTFEI